jgi:catechol 2,3-dioxygenase-like lactoylglutathione lyase family enzyme
MPAEGAPAFERLDFVYMPSRDAAADVRWFAEVLGARVVFAVEGMGTRVAMVQLTDDPPAILLAEHLEGDRPVLVYRVPRLFPALDELERRGWTRGSTFEIPHGPICSFEGPGGQRIALYELTRPDAAAHFTGRRDF